jgi:hypothetical protein
VRAVRSVALAAGGICLAGIVAATVAARHAHPAEVSPVVPDGSWNAVWLTALAVALLAYALGCLAAWRARHSLRLPVLAIAVSIQVVPLAAPLLLSKDVYLYWAGARVVTAHGGSPYRNPPAAFPHDVALPYVSEQWRDEGSPYGPTWQALTLLPAVAVSTPKGAVVAYRLLAVAGVLATLLLLWRVTPGGASVALLGWNPLVALHFAGGGHSDGWLVFLICFAVVAGRRAAGGGAWALSAAFKPPPLVLAPLDLAASRFRRPRAYWAGVVGGVVVVLILSAIWGFGWIRTSLVGIHGTAPLGGVHWLTEAGLSHREAVAVAFLAFAAAYVALFVSAWRTGRARLSIAALALCLTSSLLRPWYAIWPVALAALEVDGVAAIAAVGFSAYLVLADAGAF